jgi:hypothetical protein
MNFGDYILEMVYFPILNFGYGFLNSQVEIWRHVYEMVSFYKKVLNFSLNFFDGI